MTMLDEGRETIDLSDDVGIGWVDVCAARDLVPGRGVCALVADEQIAIFLLANGSLHAIDNRDPFSGSYVLSRGITGTVGDAPTVASPIYKQRFDLRSGTCIDDATVSVKTFGVRCVNQRVLVRAR